MISQGFIALILITLMVVFIISLNKIILGFTMNGKMVDGLKLEMPMDLYGRIFVDDDEDTRGRFS